ncbi:MAG TPA: SpoVG family protein [Thermaerobacter sp.]
MHISEVRVRPIKGAGRMRAFASVVFDGSFVVHELKVVEGSEGRMFVAFPSKRAASGEYFDIAHPITAEAREHIQRVVLAAYHEQVGAPAAVAEEAR